MSENTIRLATLPVELLHCIFTQLDPVALIATSQTCSYFRTIIKPARKHFAERLLALEIQPEHGGPAFRYFARENRLEPDWNEDAWDDMRWACSRCLQLLSHAAFDNHSLLRLRNRKPAPGSPAAKTFSGLTSWEPVESRALSAKEQRRKTVIVTEEKHRERLLKKQYHLATTKILTDSYATYTLQTRTSFLHAAELPEAEEFSDDQLDLFTEGQEHALLDRAAYRIEGLRAGSHRHLRKCNECRFQLGNFKKGPGVFHHTRQQGQNNNIRWALDTNKGTPEVPIVRSRRLKFTTTFDRYFPGIAPYMSAERPDFVLPLWRIYREDTTYVPITLHMARCPSCETWKELREFRWRPRGWGYGEYIGVSGNMTVHDIERHCEEVSNIQCNSCVCDKLGRPALARQLSTFMKARLDEEARTVLSALAKGWRTLEYPPTRPRHRIKQLVASLQAAEKKFATVKLDNGGTGLDIDAEDVEDNLAMMNSRRLEWLQISKEDEDFANACLSSQDFAVWHGRWDEAMGYWRWLRAWTKEIEDEREKLVRWALERRPTKLN